jgi:RNA polymerase sigma factor (sigma-70 family)
LVAVPSIGRADRQQPARTAPEAEVTRRLYEQYARQIYAYCLQQLRSKEEAEDATQSTFLNAFRGLQRGIDPEFESAWLYKIAQNVCLTRQRSSTRRRRVESPGDLDAIQDALPAREVPADELIGLPEALHGMPEQQRRALLLREWQGLSYREIAEELDLSQAAVETLIFRARRTLAGGLSEPTARGGDAGSLVAKSLLFTGGTKVAATVATVAATSVVAATPTARHAVEHAVVNLHPPAAKSAHVASHRSATAVAKPKPVVAHPSTAAVAESTGATVRRPVAKRRHARHPAVQRASAVQRALPGHVPADPAPVAPAVPAAAAPAPPTVTVTTATTTTPVAAPAPAPATPSPAPTAPQPTAPTATRKGSDPGKRTGGGTVAAPVVTVPVATAPVTTAPVASAPAPAPPRHPRGREIHGPWVPVPVDTTPTTTTATTPTPPAPPVTTTPVTTTPAPPVTTTPAPPPVPAPPVPGPPRVRVGIGR